MAYPLTADLAVKDDAAFLAPAMAAEPLQTALGNLNWLYVHHTPALLSVCPTELPTTRAQHYDLPIRPSADGLPYVVRLIIVPTETTTIDIDVETTAAYTETGATWTALDSVAALAVTADTRTVWSGYGVIPANAEAIRITLDAADGVPVLHHILVYPDADEIALPTAETASGFIPFDDTMISQTGAAIHTEHVNRCKASSLAVLRDRWQCAFSYCAVASGATDYPVTYTEGWAAPPVRLWLPYQGPTVELQVYVIADVNGGATSDLVSLWQVGITPTAEPARFDASGNVEQGTLTIHLQGEAAARYADLQWVAWATSGNTTNVRAIIAFWRPGD